MAVVAISQQVRIIDAAVRCLGHHGGELIRTAAIRALGTQFDDLSYEQLDVLLDSLQHQAPVELRKTLARRLIDEIERQCNLNSVDIAEPLLDVLSRFYGPSADQFLLNVHAQMGGAPTVISAAHLAEVAEIAGRLTRMVLGQQSAAEIAEAIQTVTVPEARDVSTEALRIAAEHAGIDGEAGLREICRERLEIEIEELPSDGLTLLKWAIEQDGGRAFVTRALPTFVDAVRAALHEPGVRLRGEITSVAGLYLGPAYEIVLRRACARQGVPFEACTYEHVNGLALALRDDARQFVGEEVAGELARSVAGLLSRPV